MKEKVLLHKYELVEKLPDGTLRYRVVRARRVVSNGGVPPKVHERPRRGLRKSRFENVSSRIEQYLSGVDRAQTMREIAEFLEVTSTSAYSTLQLMEVFGTVLKVKRGGRHYYLPQGVYSDEQISAMLPSKKTKPNEELSVD